MALSSFKTHFPDLSFVFLVGYIDDPAVTYFLTIAKLREIISQLEEDAERSEKNIVDVNARAKGETTLL